MRPAITIFLLGVLAVVLCAATLAPEREATWQSGFEAGKQAASEAYYSAGFRLGYQTAMKQLIDGRVLLYSEDIVGFTGATKALSGATKEQYQNATVKWRLPTTKARLHVVIPEPYYETIKHWTNRVAAR